MQRELELQNDPSMLSAIAETGRYALSHSVSLLRVRRETGRPQTKRESMASAKSCAIRRTRAPRRCTSPSNAFVVLDGGSDASHRMYGCLYGLELYAGQNPVPIVPSAVSTASAIQKLISGVLIFLFGLALRNMLKVK